MSLAKRILHAVEGLLAMLLVSMLVMVLGNVVLRYGFGTGIEISEELSRVMFIWLTFIGAILAMHDGAHLGMDGIQKSLPRLARIGSQLLSELIMLSCCILIFWGSWQQHEVNASTRSLVMGMPMIWVFGVGYVTSVGMGVLILRNIWVLVRNLRQGTEPAGQRGSEDVSHSAAKGEHL